MPLPKTAVLIFWALTIPRDWSIVAIGEHLTVIAELTARLEYFLTRSPSGRSVQAIPGIAVGSLQGPERQENQDRAVVALIGASGLPNKLIALVCDGLGGMAEGGKSATIAASAFLAKLAQFNQPLSQHSLREAVLHANHVVFENLGGDGGTTLAALAIEQNSNAWCVYAGDSRIYSSNGLGQLELLTKDDTLAGFAQNNLRHSEDQLDNRLLQFVGIGDSLEPHISSIADSRRKRFIITSDGAHGFDLPDILYQPQ